MQQPDGCVLKGCDEPWFAYDNANCGDPGARPVMGALPTTGTVGTAYSGTVTLDSALDWSFAVVRGALPAGLVLAQTSHAFSVSGTPTTVGVYSFTIVGTNGWGITTSGNYTIMVNV